MHPFAPHLEVAVPRTRTRHLRRIAAVALLVATVAGLGVAGAPHAEAKSRWAAVGTAPIHPGVRTYSPTGSCSANFVFFKGAEVYLGQAAHCTAQGDPDAATPCQSGSSLPLGTPVEVTGATKPATLAYSSWLAMFNARETNPFACADNDFALLRIDPADRSRVNPTVPHWGGPTGINKTGLAFGSSVYSFGDSELRGGIPLLRPRSGFAIATYDQGWWHEAYTLLPGIPGDSGSAVLDGNGLAVGTLTTINLTPRIGSNGYTDLHHSFQYARTHGMDGLLLALGTKPFNGAQLPLG